MYSVPLRIDRHTGVSGCNFPDTFVRRESLVKGIPVITVGAEESNVSIIGPAVFAERSSFGLV